MFYPLNSIYHCCAKKNVTSSQSPGWGGNRCTVPALSVHVFFEPCGLKLIIDFNCFMVTNGNLQ